MAPQSIHTHYLLSHKHTHILKTTLKPKLNLTHKTHNHRHELIVIGTLKLYTHITTHTKLFKHTNNYTLIVIDNKVLIQYTNTFIHTRNYTLIYTNTQKPHIRVIGYVEILNKVMYKKSAKNMESEHIHFALLIHPIIPGVIIFFLLIPKVPAPHQV